MGKPETTYAVIDVGSNTMRLSVYSIDDGRIDIMFHKKEMAGLANYVDETGRLDRQGIRRAVDVLGAFRSTLGHLGVKLVYPFATASLRNIGNTDEVIAAIHAKTGYDVQVLSGREEAECDFRGAMSAIDLSEGLLVDIGGGSTEIVPFRKRRAQTADSLPIGSLSLYRDKVGGLLPDAAERASIEATVAEHLGELAKPEGLDTSVICGVGGTIRAVARLVNDHFDLPGDNRTFDIRDVEELLALYAVDDKESHNRILRVIPERIHTIVPGMLVLATVAAHYESRKVAVSSCGVREGYLLSLLKRDGLI